MMTLIERIDLRADSIGTLELVCERTEDGDELEIRTFVGNGEFGLLVDDLKPNEPVALFIESGTQKNESPAE